jgi:predicted Zn finger-like uncharacterized protein
MARFECPSCGKKFRVSAELAGRKVKCPGCGVVLAVPKGVARPPRPRDLDDSDDDAAALGGPRAGDILGGLFSGVTGAASSGGFKTAVESAIRLVSLVIVAIILFTCCVWVPLVSHDAAPSNTAPGQRDAVAHPEAAPKENAKEAPAIQTTVPRLLHAYEDNAIAADRDYKGKVVEVRGVVASVSKDILGTPFVLLTDGNEFAIVGVQCLFPRSAADELTSLRKNHVVSIRGRCTGKFGNVLLDKCTLVD